MTLITANIASATLSQAAPQKKSEFQNFKDEVILQVFKNLLFNVRNGDDDRAFPLSGVFIKINSELQNTELPLRSIIRKLPLPQLFDLQDSLDPLSLEDIIQVSEANTREDFWNELIELGKKDALKKSVTEDRIICWELVRTYSESDSKFKPYYYHLREVEELYTPHKTSLQNDVKNAANLLSNPKYLASIFAGFLAGRTIGNVVAKRLSFPALRHIAFNRGRETFLANHFIIAQSVYLSEVIVTGASWAFLSDQPKPLDRFLESLKLGASHYTVSAALGIIFRHSPSRYHMDITHSLANQVIRQPLVAFTYGSIRTQVSPEELWTPSIDSKSQKLSEKQEEEITF